MVMIGEMVDTTRDGCGMGMMVLVVMTVMVLMMMVVVTKGNCADADGGDDG